MIRLLIALLLSLPVLAQPAGVCRQAPCIGPSIPTAAQAVVGLPYTWTGAATANTCPSNGAGAGVLGSAIAVCQTIDNVDWLSVVSGSPSGVLLPGGISLNMDGTLQGPNIATPTGATSTKPKLYPKGGKWCSYDGTTEYCTGTGGGGAVSSVNGGLSGTIDASPTTGNVLLDVHPGIFGGLVGANTWTGANDFHTALLRMPSTTVASLPAAASNAGREFMVTDGASACDFTVGSGIFQVLVKAKEDGSAYVAPNCGGGSAIPNSSLIPYSNVMFWGDSLTQGTGASGPVIFPDSGVVQNALPLQVQQLSGANVNVWGRSGNTSAQISAGCTGSVSRAGWLNIIWAGTNDPGNSISYTTTISNVNACIATLTGPYIVMTPLTNASASATWAPSGATYLSYFQPLQAAMISAYGDHLIDAWQIMINAACSGPYADSTACTEKVPPPPFVWGGPHLTDLGYSFIAAAIYTWMQSHGGGSTPNITSLNNSLYQSGAYANSQIAIGSGTGNGQIATITPSLVAPRDGTFFCYTPLHPNTASVTLSVNDVFNYPMVKIGGAALTGGELTTTAKACVVLHASGTGSSVWELQNPQNGGGAPTLTGVTTPLLAVTGYPQDTILTGSAGAKAVKTYVFTNPTAYAIHGLMLNVTGTVAPSTCNGGAGPCGSAFAIWTTDPSNANPPAGATLLCGTVAGTPGGTPDTGTTGPKKYPFATGSAFSSGLCTLPAGTHILAVSDESGAMQVAGANGTLNQWFTVTAVTPFFLAYTSPIGTGTGSSYAVPSLTSVTFNADPFAGNSPVIWTY